MSYKYKSKVLERLGVRSWINAKNWNTNIGGTWIDDRVLNAMNEVAKTFVDMNELISKADERVAKLCKVDDAHITCGCAAAIELSVAGCIAGNNYGNWIKLPNTEGLKNEVIMHRSQFISYQQQWMAPGAKIIEYGRVSDANLVKEELESAITNSTCCLSYTFSYSNTPKFQISLKDIVEIGRKKDVPVIVDAASMLPPVSNLQKYINMGADIVCFSGGKAIKAPNNTGFLIGNDRGAKIIESIRNQTFPHLGWGRALKISKEQIIGLVVALEIFIEEGDTLFKKQMKTAEHIMKELNDIPGLNITLIPNDDILHEHPIMPHVPRILMKWDADKLGITMQDMDKAMAQEDPPIFLRDIIYSDYYTNNAWRMIDTYFIRDDEEKIIIERIKKIFSKN